MEWTLGLLSRSGAIQGFGLSQSGWIEGLKGNQGGAVAGVEIALKDLLQRLSDA